MNTWNYRIVRKYDPEEKNYFYEIHDCHYEQGELVSWGADPVSPYGDDPDELRADLQMMLDAFPRGILNEEDLPE